MRTLRKAQQLLQQIPSSSQPAYLLQAAQIAQLNGENRKALTLLRSAQWQNSDNTLKTSAGQLSVLGESDINKSGSFGDVFNATTNKS